MTKKDDFREEFKTISGREVSYFKTNHKGFREEMNKKGRGKLRKLYREVIEEEKEDIGLSILFGS